MGSYLSFRHQRVKLSDVYSTWQQVSRGVPQGSVLGPTLFNIFMNDLAYVIKQSRIINYADDTTIHYSSNQGSDVETILNLDLNKATSWFSQNGMKANPHKYQAMVLGKIENDLQFKASEESIKTTDQTKLLGVLLDNKLKFDAHISNVCRKVSAQINALNRLKNILSVKTKESLYRSFVLPYFYYCSQVWHNCGKRNTNKLE